MNSELIFSFLLITGFLSGGGLFFFKSLYLPMFSLSLLNLVGWLFFSFRYLSSISPHKDIYTFASISEIGLQVSFLVDGLSALFLLLISAIGIFVLIFSNSYFSQKEEKSRCIGLLQLFALGMIGLVCSENLIVLFVFWEITTLLSYLLISFNGEAEYARKAALHALFITAFGGICMLIGIMLSYSHSNTLSITELLSHPRLILESPYFLIILIMFLMGALTKSAQFPFHFWLPGAMAAPAPVSAFLHSATMVKAGVYLLFRLNPLFQGTLEWMYILIVLGFITAILSILLAFRTYDLKQILAYTTLSALGVLVALIGIGTENSLKAAIIFLVVHAFYKAGLFIAVGAFDKIYGTRNFPTLKNLAITSPLLSCGIVLLSFSMIGLPPVLGFLAKEMIYGVEQYILFFVIINIVNAAVGVSILKTLWVDKKIKIEIKKKESIGLWIAPVMFGGVGLILSFTLNIFSEYILFPAHLAIQYSAEFKTLELWHGFNVALFLSALTVIFGIILSKKHIHLVESAKSLDKKIIEAPKVMDHILSAIVFVCERVKQVFFSGSHTLSLIWLFSFISILIFSSGFKYFDFLVEKDIPLVFGRELLFLLLIIVPLFFCVVLQSTLAIVFAAGLSGIGLSMYFALFSAPDLALTQILVETFCLILFLYVAKNIKKSNAIIKSRKTFISAFVSFCFAAGVCMALYSITSPQLEDRVSYFFVSESYNQAFGKNIVNVILVDFRSFDTIGEIAVLAIAITGIYKLFASKGVIKK